MHADTHGGHVVFAVFFVFFVDLLDQRIAFERPKGNHIKNVPGLFASLFAHFYTANTLAADFVDRMHAKEGSQFFHGGETRCALYFDDQPDGGFIADTVKGFEQFDFRPLTALDHLLTLCLNCLVPMDVLPGCGDNELFCFRIGGRGNRAFGIGDKLFGLFFRRGDLISEQFLAAGE